MNIYAKNGVNGRQKKLPRRDQNFFASTFREASAFDPYPSVTGYECSYLRAKQEDVQHISFLYKCNYKKNIKYRCNL